MDEKSGSFEPFSIIAQKEGGGEGGAQAAINYCTKCLALAREGVQFNGRSLIEYNEWTKRWEFAYIKKSFRSVFECRWGQEAMSAPPKQEPE
eukprot:2612244-Alexandrium_andersonii.AAC.1